VDNGDPRRNSIAIDLKDVDRYEFYVCGEEAIYLSYADHKIGWFPEIICKDYPRPKASETILSAEPNNIKSQWPIQKRNSFSLVSSGQPISFASARAVICKYSNLDLPNMLLLEPSAIKLRPCHGG
jgi:hypothetical protein